MTPASTVIVVGAPRSGTNLLRDVLCSVPGVATWPCDEINYVWRHGNRDARSDELPVEAATADVERTVRRSFGWVRKRYASPTVVEKTCATSLRVPFVDALLPEARYVFIHRDGIDAAASASVRWNADLELRYLARKARFVPARDLPHYARRFLAGRAPLRERRAAATWGPRFAGIDDAVAARPLDEVCALQWQRCVELATEALAGIDPARVHRVGYEDFVRAPHEHAQAVLSFLDVEGEIPARALADVRIDSIGAGRRTWVPEQVDRVEALIAPTLENRVHA